MSDVDQTTTVNAEDVEVERGYWGTMDFRGVMGVNSTGYVLDRLTFRVGALTFSVRGRSREIDALIEQINELATPHP